MEARKSALLKGALLLICVLVAIHLVDRYEMTLGAEGSNSGASIPPSSSNMNILRSFRSIDSKPKNLQRNVYSADGEGETGPSSVGASLPSEVIGTTEDLGLEGLVVNRADMPESLLPLEHVGANKKSTLPSISDPDANLPMRDSPAAISFRGPWIYDPDFYIPNESREDVNSKNAPKRWINNPDGFLPRNKLPSGSDVSGQYIGDPEEYLPEHR